MKIGKNVFEVKNLEKEFFPKDHYTKKDLMDYYERIAEFMLPHLLDRPLTMVRFPNGIDGKKFYQKDEPIYFPDWISSLEIQNKGEGKTNYIICNDLATLVYLASQACISPHLFLSKKDKLNFPDRLIFDLDPSDDDFSKIIDVSEKLKDFLSELNLPVFIMTTGSRGVHLVIPIKRIHTFEKTRKFAQEIAEYLEKKYPDVITTAARKNKRGNKVYMDTTRNAFAQTTISPYGVRPFDKAPVATPIEWDELKSKNFNSQIYTMKNVFERLEKHSDPWKDMNAEAVSLSSAMNKLEELQIKLERS